MPGMMDTVLNIGLNDETVKPLLKLYLMNEQLMIVIEDLYRCLAM